MTATDHNPCMSKEPPRDPDVKTAFAVRAGHRIKDRRVERGWTQRELSERTGHKLSPSRIANYEQGTREPGIQEAEILAQAMHVQAAYLMGISALKNPLTPIEEELIKNWRILPQNERSNYFKRLEALALAYRIPVADENLGPGWKAPEVQPSDEQIKREERPAPAPRRHRKVTSKQS